MLSERGNTLSRRIRSVVSAMHGEDVDANVAEAHADLVDELVRAVAEDAWSQGWAARENYVSFTDLSTQPL